MTDTKALKELLPKVEAATDRVEDETLGRLMCAFRGIEPRGPWGGVFEYGYDDDPRGRNGWPDVSLDAIRALARDVDCTMESGPDDPCAFESGFYSNVWASRKKWRHAYHPTSEPLACLIALMRAKIAEGEANDA